MRYLDSSYYGIDNNFSSKTYRHFSDFDIEMMLQPTNIKRYIELVIEVQKLEECKYFPLSNGFMDSFFSKISPNFKYKNLKYTSEDNLDVISEIISYIGKSGYNYIKNVGNVTYLNQPVLLFYGIEQLSTFFSYIHFNFTEENVNTEPIREKFRRHGIGRGDFNIIKSELSIDEILSLKIILTTQGAAQRFFFVLGFPFQEFFYENKRYSLKDLMQIFFLNLNIGLSNDTQQKFIEDFDLNQIELADHPDFDMLIFYILSFLFSHLSRYKIYTWQIITQTEERNLGLYIKYIMERIKDLYLRKMITILYYEKERMGMFIKQPKRRKLFKERWDNFLKQNNIQR
ncbi:MAG: hypothetical protein V3V33_06380 [Candidatus Lokiarchaeia archaeon]